MIRQDLARFLKDPKMARERIFPFLILDSFFGDDLDILPFKI
jgi:hypothetical protein